MLEDESDYRAEMELREKMIIFNFQSSTSEAHREARVEREKVLYRSNVATLKHIIDWCKGNIYYLLSITIINLKSL